MGSFNYRLYKDRVKIGEHEYERMRILEIWYSAKDQLTINGFAEINADSLIEYSDKPIINSESVGIDVTYAKDCIKFKLHCFNVAMTKPVLTIENFKHLPEQP